MSSLNGAMNTAVSALKAQSKALAMVSDNLANSSTVGYKSTHARFATLVTDSAYGTYYASGGVTSSARQNVDLQGLIESSDNDTDMAIDGNGMFVVTGGLDSDELLFTRNGEFDIDDDGYLVNSGYYLMGWATDSDGNVANPTSSTLEAININRYTGIARATSEVDIEANLSASAAVGDSYSTTIEVVDSLGVTHALEVTFEKTAENTWSMSYADPTSGSADSGDASGGPVTITFNDDGTLADPASATLTIANWTTGAADSIITLDLGTVGTAAGLSQYSSDFDATSSGNGLEYGSLSGVEIGDDGSVVAKYDNGQELTIYKIAVATFPNYDGLEALSNNIYARSTTSGAYSLHLAGTGGAGDIQGNAVEASTVDTSDEFTRMIVAQQAYSAASQIISTVQDMYDDLMSAVR